MTIPTIRATALIHDESTGQDSGIHSGTMPPSVQDGDIGVLFATAGTGAATATVAGWTAIAGPLYVDTNLAGYVFAKELSAAEAGATVTVTWSAPAFGVGVLAVVQDADSLAELVAASTALAAGGTSLAVTPITTPEDDCAVLQMVVGRVATGTVLTITGIPPSTTLADSANTARTTTPNFTAAMAYRTAGAPTAGNYGTTGAWTAGQSTTGALSFAVALTPAPVNAAPTANAGSDQSASTGDPVTLSGSDSDTDGTIASRLWTQLSGPTASLSGATTATASFVPSTAGTYVFQYEVTDDDGATGSDTCTVTVTGATDDGGLRVYVVDGSGVKQECNVYVVSAAGAKQQIAMKEPS